MKKNTYFITAIIVLLLIASIWIYLSQKKTEFGDEQVMGAQKIFESKLNVSSESDAKNLISENYKEILKGTQDFYAQNPSVLLNERYLNFKHIMDSVNGEWKFSDAEAGLRGCCAGYFWTGNESEKYVVTIPSSVKGTKEITTCNNVLEQPITNGETGETGCSSGIKNKETINLQSNLMYIIDTDGNVYFAGVYAKE